MSTMNKKARTTGRKLNTLLRSFAAAVCLSSLGWHPAPVAARENLTFPMQVSSGAASCLPFAQGRVTVSHVGPVENLHVEVYGLRPNTDYDLFVIQTPEKPFGLSWYQGDIETDASGVGIGDFVGRFSRETFIVAPGQAVVPTPAHPEDAPWGTQNPAIVQPIHTFHLGLWFNSPDDAAASGCADTVTPFNGDHHAGIQVLNTGSFADDQGPLLFFNP